MLKGSGCSAATLAFAQAAWQSLGAGGWLRRTVAPSEEITDCYAGLLLRNLS